MTGGKTLPSAVGMLGVGIVGFGKMGRIRAATLEADGRAHVVAVHDPAGGDSGGYAAVASMEALLANPTIGAIVIAATNDVNKACTLAALRAGKHVLCEKPPAFTTADLREIMALESSTGRVLMYGFNHRHHGGVLKMKAAIDSGAYGRVLWMRGRYGKSVDRGYLKTWRADKARAGGGILLDQGIHMLDLFLHMGGVPLDDVHAFVSSRYWKIAGIEDNVFAIMRDSTSGLEVSFHSTMTQWRHLFSLEVFLERGYLVLNGLKTPSGSYGEEELTIARNRSTAPAARFDEEERFLFPVDQSWALEAEHFLDAICAGQPVRHGNSQQALQVMDLVERIYAHGHRVASPLHEDLQAAADAPV